MTELHNFDLNLLVAFDLLMEEKNVSRAAERLFVTQSAMSHTLQRLRQQLDDPLLVKTPGGMKPTERALSLVDPVKALLRDIKRLIRAPEEFVPAQSRRRFVIAATDYMDLLVLPPLIERIALGAPGIDIHVKRTESPFPEADLEHNDLDVVLGFDAILKPPGYLSRTKLFDDRMACVVGMQHMIGKSGRLTLEEYVLRKHMLISRTGTRVGLIDEWLAERGLARRIALIVPHFLSAPFIVAKTDMILSLPERIAIDFIGLAPLKIVSIPIELPAYDLVMVWHPLHDLDPAHRWLRDQIVEVSRNLRV
ncbi:LysR family transcriptional regulator [Methylocystis sp. SB2]|uniref:LysR family transcriptional regulator n=1 Tax=Methylocystis sp. (strain SB2) TaxID=743836 RepID=UPI000425B1ED|nr:LysR family transcriptional regulator [Methylocystis sp. SB2]ULO23797.1 LysR family transcriptional regulator [Methylocystis sp. SB2]